MLVPGSTEPGFYTNRVVLHAVSGTTYQIAICDSSWSDVWLAIAPSAPPSLHIVSPVTGAQILSGVPAEIRALAGDDTGPVVVDFFLDNQLVAHLPDSPFVTSLQFSDPYGSSHTLSARATDLNGLATWDEVTFQTLPPIPPNDAFAARTPLSGFLVLEDGTTLGSTAEPGELGFGSVWWSWTAPATGRAYLQADIDASYIRFTVYTGNGLGITDLTRVATADSMGNGASALAFDAVTGIQYQLSAEAVTTWQPAFRFSLYLDAATGTQLGGTEILADGSLRLRLTTLAEQEWVLQGSTNLVDWVPLSTNSSLRHVIEFVAPPAPSWPAGFYRTVGSK
jgi:hypothetical protein